MPSTTVTTRGRRRTGTRACTSLLLALTVVIYALVCAVYLRHRAASWFHPLTIYLAFHGLVFVVRPILSYLYGYTFIYRLYLFAPDDYAKAMTLVAVNLGLLSFAVASLRWGGARLAFRADRFGAAELRAMARPLWLAALPLLPFAAYSLYQAWALRGSAQDALDMDLTTGTTINTGGNGYVQFGYIALATLVPLLAWAGRFRPWWLAAAGFVALVMAGVGIRGPIASLLVCLATLYLYARRRRAPDWRIAAVAAAGVLAFNAVGADRGQEVRTLLGGERAAMTQSAEQMAPLEGMDLGSLEYVEFLVDKVPRDTRTYEYFVDNLQVATEPIPRVLWPGKPIGQPVRLFYLFDYGYPIGMTRSLPGEGWTQLGLIGVVLWCGLWGGICGAVYNRFARGSQTPLQIAFYAAFLSTLIVFYRDGLFITLLRQGLFFVVPPLLWWLAARATGVADTADLRLRAKLTPGRGRRRRDPGEDTGSDRASGAQDRLLPRSRRHARRPAASPRG